MVPIHNKISFNVLCPPSPGILSRCSISWQLFFQDIFILELNVGAQPVSCYTSQTHPHGIASQLEYGRTLLTHSSSSTSTCPTTAFFLYDVQGNGALSNVDSRLIIRHGFKVDLTSRYGLAVRDKKQTDLTESVDSHQAALDLAGSQPYVSAQFTKTCHGQPLNMIQN